MWGVSIAVLAIDDSEESPRFLSGCPLTLDRIPASRLCKWIKAPMPHGPVRARKLAQLFTRALKWLPRFALAFVP